LSGPGCIKLTILSLRGTSGAKTEERGNQQERASSPHLSPPSDGREGTRKKSGKFLKTIFAFARTISIIFSELGNLSISRLGRSSVESVFQ
jgi:hypothetical protein